jgi:hypothetical protein
MGSNFSSGVASMTSVLSPEMAEAGTALPVPILEILTDDTLSMGEKLLMLEALFVHDAPVAENAPSHSGQKKAALVAA